jgi:predicted signal transduction protein with EAL and GGDEF domain
MMMTRLGCTELQGYYFSKPVDAERMTDLLASFQPRRPVSALTPVQLPHGAVG